MDACVAELQGGVGFQLVIAGKKVIQGNHFLRVQGQNIVYRILIYRLQKQQQFAGMDIVAVVAVLNSAVQILAVLQHQFIHHIFDRGIGGNWVEEIKGLLFPLGLVGTVNLAPLLEIAV